MPTTKFVGRVNGIYPNGDFRVSLTSSGRVHFTAAIITPETSLIGNLRHNKIAKGMAVSGEGSYTVGGPAIIATSVKLAL